MSDDGPQAAGPGATQAFDESPEGLTALLKEVLRLSFEYAFKSAKDDDDAWDLALPFAMRFWRTRNSPNGYDASEPLEQYIEQCIKNLFIDGKRNQKARTRREQELSDPLDQDIPFGTDAEWRVDLWDLEKVYARALHAMPRDRAEVFIRRRQDGLSVNAIAVERGIAVPTVYAHIRLALIDLQTALILYRENG